jgi:glycogen synthase kinase 3 beta
LPDYVIVDSYHRAAIDDPRKVVKVVASDGKTGETRDISYTNCKVIGNGSFGVVFQAKLVSEHESGDDIAIKKVLQDKRFKVSSDQLSRGLSRVNIAHPLCRTVSYRS